MKRILTTVMVVGALAAPHAQQARGGDASPSQLGFYIGRWTAEGQSRATPTGSFASTKGDETCAWFSGGPSIVCRETMTDSTGETDSIYILSYDPAKKQYAVYGTDNTGAVYSGTGTESAGVWRWTAEMRDSRGAVTPMRYTFREATGGGRSMEIEAASGKGAWARIASVTYKRAR
jgi:hypothetical protein